MINFASIFCVLVGPIIAAALFVNPISCESWYVSPHGNRNNTGEIDSPWDMATLFSRYPPSKISPGDTIWLRG